MAETTLQPPAPKPPVKLPAPRRRRSFVRRILYSMQMSVRDAFSREQLIGSLKSLAWVAPMTLLIWIYAEREQTAHQQIIFHVEPRNIDPNRIVDLGMGADGRPRAAIEIRADVSGPQARLQLVKDKLENPGSSLQLDIPPNLEAGVYPISLTLLANDPLFEKNGLTVTNMSPPEVKVTVDPIQHVDLEVSVRPTITNLEGQAVFEPATVHLSAPKSVLDLARQQGKLVAYAELGSLTEPGTRTLPGVQVSVPVSDPHLNLMPATVSAKVTVKRTDEDGVIRAVPVWAIYPPSPVWDKYRAEYETNFFDVKVTGPAEVIRNINDPALGAKPKAIFDVTTSTKPIGANPGNTVYEAPIKFDFGNTGLKISPEDIHKNISFTVVERKTAD